MFVQLMGFSESQPGPHSHHPVKSGHKLLKLRDTSYQDEQQHVPNSQTNPNQESSDIRGFTYNKTATSYCKKLDSENPSCEFAADHGVGKSLPLRGSMIFITAREMAYIPLHSA
jgi:hypothetical protein